MMVPTMLLVIMMITTMVTDVKGTGKLRRKTMMTTIKNGRNKGKGSSTHRRE